MRLPAHLPGAVRVYWQGSGPHYAHYSCLRDKSRTSIFLLQNYTRAKWVVQFWRRNLEFRNSLKAKLNQRDPSSPQWFECLWIKLPPLLTAILSCALGYAWIGFWNLLSLIYVGPCQIFFHLSVVSVSIDICFCHNNSQMKCTELGSKVISRSFTLWKRFSDPSIL